MTKEQKENALVTTGDSLMAQLSVQNPDAMDDGLETPSQGKYYPFMEMVFPIMITPDKPHYKGQEYNMGFVAGNEFHAFPEGTIFTLFDARNAIKRVYDSEEGKKNEFYSAKIERNGQVFEASNARFEELKADAQNRENREVQLGISAVVVAIVPGEEQKYVALNFSAFKTVNSYMFPILQPCKLQKQAGLQVNIGCHECNLTKAKASGFYYPDGKKFKQFNTVTLTKEQLTGCVTALQETAEEYENWLNS